MENWLSTHLYGWDDLSQEEKASVFHFAMLWSFFENYVLETNASATRIIEKITHWNNDGKINIDDFNNIKQYFVDRYIENGATNQRFQHLHLRHNDRPQLVQDVLLGNIDDPISIVSALLIIVFRYRNNLFHGLKWEYALQDQLTNFINANSILAKMIELE